MKKLVSEALSDILKPKSQEDVANEIKRRIAGKNLTTIKENSEFTIYQVKNSNDIKEIIKNFGGREEDIFFNFYLILDNSISGFKQVIGVKVSPDSSVNAMDASGKSVDEAYLNKFN